MGTLYLLLPRRRIRSSILVHCCTYLRLLTEEDEKKERYHNSDHCPFVTAWLWSLIRLRYLLSTDDVIPLLVLSLSQLLKLNAVSEKTLHVVFYLLLVALRTTK